MQIRNGSDRFGTLARGLHWTTFLLLLGSFGIGLTMVDMPLSPRKLQVYSWHKWIGVTVFLIAILRLGWRCLHPPPPYPDSMPAWQKVGARLSHGTLYGLLLLMPISGWVMSSALGIPTAYLGLVPLPDPVAPDRELGQSLILVHNILGLALAALIALHIAAAIYHHFVLKDDIMRRMMPFMTVGGSDRS
jgi:cytochrome b561